jgi:hypothetical protein
MAEYNTAMNRPRSFPRQAEPVDSTFRVFLNMAYGPESETLALAYISALDSLELVPALALQTTDSGRRLDHIRTLLSSCAYSLHDLYRIGESRWNMILELGMAIECTSQHHWSVLDSNKRRALRALSDLNGTDIFEHFGKPSGVIGAVLDIFSRPGQRITVQQVARRYRTLRAFARRLLKQQKAGSVFEPRIFTRLVEEAVQIRTGDRA